MKKMLLRKLVFIFYTIVLCLTVVSCTSFQLAGYDQKAYENATTLKPQTLALVTKSGTSDSYSTNTEKLDALFIQLESAFEYANGVNHNNEAASNWRDLINDILENWHDVWKENQQLSPSAASEIGGQIRQAFDTIICLEANKRQLTECN